MRSRGVSYEALVAMVKKVIEETVTTRDVRHKDIAGRVLVSPKHFSRMINGTDGMSLDIVDRILAACNRRLVLNVVPITANETHCTRNTDCPHDKPAAGHCAFIACSNYKSKCPIHGISGE